MNTLPNETQPSSFEQNTDLCSYYFFTADRSDNEDYANDDSPLTKWEEILDSLTYLYIYPYTDLQAYVRGTTEDNAYGFFAFNKAVSEQEARTQLNLPHGNLERRPGYSIDDYITVARLTNNCCFQEGFFETEKPQYTRFTFQYNHEDTDWELEEDFVTDIFQSIASSSIIKRFAVRQCKGDTEFAHNLHAFFVTKEPTSFPDVPLLLYGTLEPAMKDEEYEFNNVINCRCSLNNTILKQNIL